MFFGGECVVTGHRTMKEKETGVNNAADGKFGTLVVVVGKRYLVDALFGSNHTHQKPAFPRKKKKSSIASGILYSSPGFSMTVAICNSRRNQTHRFK